LGFDAEGGKQIDYSGHAYQPKIYLVRRTRVMLDADLAKLCGVTTSSLNQAGFRLGKKDMEYLISQFVFYSVCIHRARSRERDVVQRVAQFARGAG
jgi:hypothetical protein